MFGPGVWPIESILSCLPLNLCVLKVIGGTQEHGDGLSAWRRGKEFFRFMEVLSNLLNKFCGTCR